MDNDLHISANLKAIEEIKAELLTAVAVLYRRLADFESEDDEVLDTGASAVALGYILMRRLGSEFSATDERIAALAEEAQSGGHYLETEFGDMSRLEDHIKKR